MAYNIHLSRLASGNFAKWFESRGHGSWIINWYDDFDSTVLTPYNFVDTNTGVQYSVMYPTSSFEISSFIHESLPSESLKYLEQLCPNTISGIVHLAQYDDMILGIGGQTQDCIKARFLPEDAAEFALVPSTVSTPDGFEQYKKWQQLRQCVAIYLPSSEIALSADNEDAMANKWELSGMGWNYFIEAPIESSEFWVDFYEGRFQCNFGNMKNEYDPCWNLSAEVSADYTVSPGMVTSAIIRNTRYYTNFNVNEECVWAAYTFGKDYNNSTNPEILSSIGYYVEGNIKPTCIPMEPVSTPYLPPSSAHMFEHIERIAGFNRFGNLQLHKSNLFSVAIKDSGINSTFIGTSADKMNIQQSITNIITNIVKKISPAHTELFKIYFTGK